MKTPYGSKGVYKSVEGLLKAVQALVVAKSSVAPYSSMPSAVGNDYHLGVF